MIYTRNILASLAIAFAASAALAQTPGSPAARERSHLDSSSAAVPGSQKVVVVTGARFSYKLVERWIDEYNKVSPNVQIIVEARGSADPLKYDILAEVYRHDDNLRSKREYINVGRYAILPVANSVSAFARNYSQKGLNGELINQIFFDDIFADQERQKDLKAPYTVYTRLQKAGVPTVFANYFGHEQKDIKGNAIAGADAHLIKALLRDSTGVTYLPVPLIYDSETRNPIQGLSVLPVDMNGNKKVSDDEKFYDDLDTVINSLEAIDARDLRNIPVEYLHLSIDKNSASVEAIDFLKWVNENGSRQLHEFGYLRPEPKEFDRERFIEFASKRATN